MEKIKMYSGTDKKVINKLFLVGNGFDLALDLKTKYEDFLFWYFQRFIIKSLLSEEKRRKKDGTFTYHYNEDELFTCYSDMSYPIRSQDFDKFKTDYNSYSKLKGYMLNSSSTIKHKIKSDLLKYIFNGSTKSWVDIEGSYFRLLKKELKKETKNSIDQLNLDLLTITKLLKEYLSGLDISKTDQPQISRDYIEQFISPINVRDIIETVKERQIKSEIYYFLNFNYTRTLINILKHLDSDYSKTYGYSIESIVSHIHGDLDNEEIIFGYGDEMDKDYKQIEDLEDNRFFENIKSFKYNKFPEYRDLLRFLNSNDYQVIIYGHSCGLSDRLLLNEIFEHKKCKSIKIYYYDKQEFNTKTMDISRHFKSNQLMRQKIVEFGDEDKIPQLKQT